MCMSGHDIVVRAAVDVARPTLYAMAIIIAALVPIFSLERVEGRIFQPLAVTYSFALIAALVFAFTVVPALLAVSLRAKDAELKEPGLDYSKNLPEGVRGDQAYIAAKEACTYVPPMVGLPLVRTY